MAEPRAKPYALVAEFDRPDALLAATRQARDQGFRDIEAFSSFPIDGLAEAVGFDEHLIAPVVLIGGIVGGLIGFFLQVYVNLDFPLNIGGRPLIAWQAFTLITFELTVLGAVASGVVAMLWRNRLPRLHHPLFEVDGFQLATSDKFFLAIRASDPRFKLTSTRRFLNGLDPVRVAVAPQTEPTR